MNHILVALISVAFFCNSAFARQQVAGQTQSPKPKGDAVVKESQADEELRRLIADLTGQMRLLTAEVRLLRRVNERHASSLELLLSEDRLTRLEDNIADAEDRKAQLDAREQELLHRMRNIQWELILRGGLRREEAEAAVRADLQRALEDVRKQQAPLQARITEMQSHIERLRRRVEQLRRVLEREAKADSDK